MGRGRAKAKQTKVARELKYHSQDTDFTALQRELGAPNGPSTGFGRERPDDPDDEDEDDGWARRSG